MGTMFWLRIPDSDLQSETDVHISKISDSGYSTGCSNSQSQRSGSSKSNRSHSGSSISSNNDVSTRARIEFTYPPLSKPKNGKKEKKKQTAVPKIQGKDGSKTEVEKMETSDSGDASAMDTSSDPPETAGSEEQMLPSQIFQGLNKPSSSDPDISHDHVPKDEAMLQSKSDLIGGLKNESNKGDFFLVVSMHDGKVVYTTPTITEVLGFPKDMWLGRSFVDFIHHKDRIAFDDHISAGIAKAGKSFEMQPESNGKHSKSTFFCCLRKYRGLKNSGFGVRSKEVQYLPFQLSLSFKEGNSEATDTFIVINAIAVKTAYNQPEESFLTPQFSTRQLANCAFSYVDAEAVSYLGYLPQEIIGRCIFDFYHPEDIHLIKEMYETVLEDHGLAIRSKPYRFRTQNGGYVLLETEWSAFVNLWSRKLEFTIGQHRVLRGPPNPDVFASPPNDVTFSEEVVKESKKIQEGIKSLLDKSYPNQNSESSKRHVSKRCKDLALFIQTIMDEIKKPKADQGEAAPGGENTERNTSEQDSVILGEISPHHNAYSKTSSETPPSYRQLNYKENIQRFFESKPKTTQGSGDDNSDVKVSTDDDEIDKNEASKSLWIDGSRASGSGSGVSGQTQQTGGSSANNCGESKRCGPLTMAVLCRHNEDMEKIMLKKHKDLRTKDGKGVEMRIKKAVEKYQDQNGHGVKRSGSDSWEAEKISKHRHVDPKPDSMNPSNTSLFTDVGRDKTFQMTPSNYSLWPQQLPGSQSGGQNSNNGIQIAGMIPIYYIPTEASNAASAQRGGELPPAKPTATSSDQLSMMNAFTMFCPPSMLYSPMMLTSQSQPPMPQSAHLQRPVPQATSVKREPGSASGNAMLCDDLKKDTPVEDSTEDEAKSKDVSGLTGDTGTGDESSYSSFSSLLKTDGSWRYSSENEPGRPNWGTRPPIKKKPPWLEDIDMTPELTFRYQLSTPELSSVLEADLAALKSINQPSMIDEQLEQLYVDLELAGLHTKVKSDSEFSSASGTSSENSGGEDVPAKTSYRAGRRKKRDYNYGQLVMIYEENMPLPPVPPTPISLVT